MEGRQYVAPTRAPDPGPITANVNPGRWMFTNSVDRSGNTVDPANSESFMALGATSRLPDFPAASCQNQAMNRPAMITPIQRASETPPASLALSGTLPPAGTASAFLNPAI